jgi:uncharacterized protein YecA (UPF0149 family)
LTDAEGAPDDAERLKRAGMGYLEDVGAALERWGDYNLDDDEGVESIEPAINPFRHVGRNDSCPCGSGKKAKKCCLAA